MKRAVRRLTMIMSVAAMLAGLGGVAHAGGLPGLQQGWLVISPLTQEYLIGGQCSIVPIGAGTVKISGTTLANQAVEGIAITLYLQVYDDASGTWEDVADWPFEKAAASSITASAIASVESGGTYRARALHEVWNAGVYEFGWSVTSPTVAP